MTSNTGIYDPYHIEKDQKMRFLSSAICKEDIEPLLSTLISGFLGKKVKLDILQIKVLRYKPTRRCIIEYEIKVYHQVNSTKNSNNYFILKLLGKSCSKNTDLRTFNLLQKLWNNGFDSQSSDLISIPRPIGHISKFNMWFQLKIDSVPLMDKLLYNDNKIENCKLISKVSDAIAKLHKTPFFPNTRFHSLSDELSILNTRLSQTMEENSCWKKEIEKILDSCYKLSTLITSTNNIKNIHRDFYHDQVIVDNNSRVYLVDLDLFCKGDPALDIGNFTAHLEEYSLRIFGDTKMFSHLCNIFISRFLEFSGNTSDIFSVNAYTLLSLARHIWISNQFSDRNHITPKLISICNSRMKSLISSSNHL